MHAVIRTYSGDGAREVFDVVERLADEVRDLIGGTPGFVSYTAFRTGDGGSTVTVCEDRAGTDESSRRAAAFLRDRMDGPRPTPVIVEGDTALQFAAGDRAGARR